MGKFSKIAKAKQASKSVKKTDQKKVRKIRTRIAFTRPHTQKTPSKPKIIRSIPYSLDGKEKPVFDYNTILIHPVAGDKNTTKMEKENIITFLVQPYANKFQIKMAFAKIYDVKVRSVNTLNTIEGKKKAYIRLKNDKEALNLATKIGIL